MFLTFVLVSAVAAALIQLGALSVRVAVLSLSLNVVLLAAFVVTGFYLWRRFTRSCLAIFLWPGFFFTYTGGSHGEERHD